MGASGPECVSHEQGKWVGSGWSKTVSEKINPVSIEMAVLFVSSVLIACVIETSGMTRNEIDMCLLLPPFPGVIMIRD